MRRLLLVFFLVPAVVSADTVFWLRNTDAQAVFQWWAAEPGPSALLLPRLPLAPGGTHGVHPGERVKIVLPGTLSLIGVFVPRSTSLSLLTPLTGGALLASEAPVSGTVQLDEAAFAAFNRGRAITAPLQAWNLDLPAMLLDGAFSDWAGAEPSLEWGPAFLPGGKAWPAGRERPTALWAADREGALWVRVSLDRAPASASPLVLALRRPGAALAISLAGADPTVWLWVDGAPPAPVGSRVVKGAQLEARIAWDRLAGSEAALWRATPLVWSLVVADGSGTDVRDLGAGTLGELP